MIEPGRKFVQGTKKFRFGFNGKEKDNEVKGEGNQQDYGMRIYDPRLGRFLSRDPIAKSYPELTPYQFASNRPVDGIDLDGLEWYKPADAVVNLSVSFDSKTHKITQATSYLIPLNIPYNLKYAIHQQRGTCDNCVTNTDINYETANVATITPAKEKSSNPEMKDIIDLPSSLKSQDNSLPIVPSNKKQAREQQKTGNFYTPGNATGNAKATAALALIDYATMAVGLYSDEQNKKVINTAKAQAANGAIAVLGIIQSEINKGTNSLILPKYQNENSITMLANYLLYGKEIENATGINAGLKAIGDKLMPASGTSQTVIKNTTTTQQINPSNKDNTNVSKTKISF